MEILQYNKKLPFLLFQTNNGRNIYNDNQHFTAPNYTLPEHQN